MGMPGGFDRPRPECPECGHNRHVTWENTVKSGIDGDGRKQTYMATIPRCREHGEVPTRWEGQKMSDNKCVLCGADLKVPGSVRVLRNDVLCHLVEMEDGWHATADDDDRPSRVATCVACGAGIAVAACDLWTRHPAAG